jgi:RNA polymerase sigma-70 factor (ECF subfamily)
MLKHEADAEDVLQRSFVDIFTKLNSFRQESAVGAWMKRIVINNCLNFLKKHRLQLQELDDRFHQVAADVPEVASSSFNVQAINEAVRELADGYRVVFSLYAIEGYDHQEIAQILGISEATSKSQYSRAKQRLRRVLQDQDLPRRYQRRK